MKKKRHRRLKGVPQRNGGEFRWGEGNRGNHSKRSFTQAPKREGNEWEKDLEIASEKKQTMIHRGKK